MNKEFKDIINKLVEAEDSFILTGLRAKKENIKTRDDLENYVFKCAFCKKMKPALEAIRLETLLNIESNPKEGGMVFTVSKKMALICIECSNKLQRRENQ